MVAFSNEIIFKKNIFPFFDRKKIYFLRIEKCPKNLEKHMVNKAFFKKFPFFDWKKRKFIFYVLKMYEKMS